MIDAGAITIAIGAADAGSQSFTVTFSAAGIVGLTTDRMHQGNDMATRRSPHATAADPKSLRTLREVRDYWGGFPQSRLGSQAKISQIESGTLMPRIEAIKEITHRLNVMIAELGGDIHYTVPEVTALCRAGYKKGRG